MTRTRMPGDRPPAWSTIDGAPPRRHLLASAVPFVQAATQLAGISRVALIGSLATDKTDPKDIDLLVTIAANADVGELDRLARQLQGRISATAHGLYGADVFLADPAGHYLGHLCKHRECPSLRRCAARHCGRRPHLKDDLDVISLDPTLVTTPPIVLWPAITLQAAAPTDVQRILLTGLRG